jgi:hypothetical protein
MQGFQAKTVNAVRSQHVVCVVRVSELRAKAFQIGFDKDGSLFIHFPTKNIVTLRSKLAQYQFARDRYEEERISNQ